MAAEDGGFLELGRVRSFCADCDENAHKELFVALIVRCSSSDV